jgi:hypothetical protein
MVLSSSSDLGCHGGQVVREGSPVGGRPVALGPLERVGLAGTTSNVDQALRPDRSAASWVSGSALSMFQIGRCSGRRELSELFDVLGPWRRAACWLLRDRALTMSTTGSSRCAARQWIWRGVCLRVKKFAIRPLSQMREPDREVEVLSGRIAFRDYLANVAWRCR